MFLFFICIVMETITSDQGIKYDIVEMPTAYPFVTWENYIHPQPSYFLQKSSRSREDKLTTTEQDFWWIESAALEIQRYSNEIQWFKSYNDTKQIILKHYKITSET